MKQPYANANFSLRQYLFCLIRQKHLTDGGILHSVEHNCLMLSHDEFRMHYLLSWRWHQIWLRPTCMDQCCHDFSSVLACC